MPAFAKILNYLTSTPFRIALATCLTFVVVALAKIVFVTQMLANGASRFSLRTQDALLTSALAAALVWFFLAAARERKLLFETQLKAIADLNHNIRNALEVIIGSEYLPQSQKVEIIVESIQRINKTLKDLELFVGPKES